jgi:hypothetical protein
VCRRWQQQLGAMFACVSWTVGFGPLSETKTERLGLESAIGNSSMRQ